MGVLLIFISKTYVWGWLLCFVFIIWSKRLSFKKTLWVFLSILYGWVWLYQRYVPKKPEGSGIVTQVQTVKSGYRYTVKYSLFNYHLYTNIPIEIGTIIHVEGVFTTYEPDQFRGDFSSEDYHKSRFVYYVIFNPKIEQKKIIRVPHIYHHRLKKHIESMPEATQLFVSSLVLGVFESDMKASITKVGITHLFVLSGLHVTIWIGFLNRCLWFLPKRLKLILQTTLLMGYLMLTLFPISLIRAVIQYLLYEWLNVDQVQYTRLDVFSFTWVGLLIVNPYYFKHTGFLLTFLVSFLFIIGSFKQDFKGMLSSTFAAQTLVLPITSKITRKVYPLAFLVTPFFIPLFTYILLPLSWLSLWPTLAHGLNPFFKSIIDLVALLEYEAIGLYIPMISGIWALFYWVFWVYAYIGESPRLKGIRMAYVVMYLMVFPFYTYVNPIGKVTFLSVGQGDTTIIERPYGSCTIVIDAFGDVVNYLEMNHIKTIDYLIITHGDYDHYKASENLLNTFEVNQLVLSKYDKGDFEKSMRKYTPTYVQGGDSIQCGDLNLHVLSPTKDFSSSNDNSIVIQTEISNATYLFTGDMEYKAEQDLVNRYGNQLQSDILKVGHHGSKTSTHTGFLHRVQPDIAVISAGRNNAFGHPHPEVIQRLNDYGVKIYQTTKVQTITFLDLPFYRRYVILVHKPG
jgi:competence protein ComEC